jgi:hypothetical protein
MRRRHATACIAMLIATCLAGPARANARILAWETHVNGIRTLLTLQVTGAQAEGVLQESGVSLPVRGTLQGQRLLAGAHDPAGGQRLLQLEGRLQGDDLVLTVRTDAGQGGTVTLRRVGTASAPAPQPAGTGQIEPSFVGRWHHDSQINSGGGAGGFAAFSTQRTLELGADGRARQWVRSAGGGSTWSHAGGQTLEFSGRWQVRGAELWVAPDGQAVFQRAAIIRRAGDYLVIEMDGERRIWRR